MCIFIDRDRDPYTLVVYLIGEIDHHTAAQMRMIIDGEVENSLPRRLILDMEKVGFMDSSGVGLILGRQRLMKKLGGMLIIKNPCPAVHKILKLAGLEELIK